MKYEYLSNIPLYEAREKLLNAMKSAGISYKTETIKTAGANGRVLANAVYAKRCSPHYCACAMDGIALKAELTVGAGESSPVVIKQGDFVRVDTGDPLPENRDCVVMIEEVIEQEDGSVKLYSAYAPWNHVRQVGEDICMGDMISPSYTKITPSMIGALLAGGVLEIEVIKKPVFAIIPTGDEIVSADGDLQSGDIPEFNSAIFIAMLEDWGCDSKVYPITPDDKKMLKTSVLKACEECDGVIVIAGSSAGRDDYTSTVLKELGTLLVHGIAIKPGKPAVLGMIGDKPFIGAPGYPVSGIIVMEEIVKKIVNKFTKLNIEDDEKIPVTLSKKLTSSLKYKEFIRCRAAGVGGKTVAVPMSRGAGIVSGFAKASGIFTVPQNKEGLEAGEKIFMKPLKSKTEIENSVCVIGSHDPLIDEIADILIRSDSSVYVSSAHVGSMGAIMSLRKNEAHLGGIHLLDTGTGEYNKSYIKKYFKPGEVTLIRGVKRKQGLMVKSGNSLNIKSVNDLTRVSYVNRQKGSGTRILLDYLLNKNGISASDIYGYTREEYTHTAVAAAVASGNADCGMGIYSAAKTYGLDFIPLWDEEYDFLVLTEALENENVRRFIEALKSEELKKRLYEMGGYKCENAGEVKQ